MKKPVDGIILVLSCQKHMHTRLREFKLSQNNFGKWEVVYVIGDLFLENDYEMREGNHLWIKCEDSYIHLLKKLALALKYVHEIYDIKEGVLRCGDDLIFHEYNLMHFLLGYKADYHGQNLYLNKSILIFDKDELKKTREDTWMQDYYDEHPEDIKNPHHNLQNVDISKYTRRPVMGFYAFGTLYYLSNHACNVVINHMESIRYDVFHLDDFSDSYPYTIEDIAIAFIMGLHDIPFTNDLRLCCVFDHTNKNR